LRVEDPLYYKNFLRIDSSQIERMTLIGFAFSNQVTVMGQAISVQDKLVVTLRFLESRMTVRLDCSVEVKKRTLCSRMLITCYTC